MVTLSSLPKIILPSTDNNIPVFISSQSLAESLWLPCRPLLLPKLCLFSTMLLKWWRYSPHPSNQKVKFYEIYATHWLLERAMLAFWQHCVVVVDKTGHFVGNYNVFAEGNMTHLFFSFNVLLKHSSCFGSLNGLLLLVILLCLLFLLFLL